MQSSSPLKSVLGTAASWLFVCAIGYGMVMHWGEMRAATAWALGVDLPEFVASATEPQPIGRDTGSRRGNERSGGYGTVELPVGANGHYSTTAMINGRPVDVMVDTGASIVALSFEDAERAGIFVRPTDFTHTVGTANGSTRVALVNLDSVSIGDITVRGVRAAVTEPGKLGVTLLGMTFLNRLSRTEMRRGTLILEE